MVAIRTDPGEREALLHEDPDTFFITPHWQSSPSTLAWLAGVDEQQLRELITDAWLARAPRRVAREFERQLGGSGADR